MTTESTIAYMDAAAEILKLDIRPEWKPNVASFFDVARSMAAQASSRPRQLSSRSKALKEKEMRAAKIVPVASSSVALAFDS